MMRPTRTTLAAAAALLTGCGGAASGAFDTAYPDNEAADIDAVVSKLAAASPPEERPVIVGLGSEARWGGGRRRGPEGTDGARRRPPGTPSKDSELFALDASDGTTLWTQSARNPRSAPHVAGRYVVLHEETGVTVRDLDGGGALTTIEDQAMHLAGADGEGAYALVSLSTGGGVGAHSKLALIDRGEVAWEVEVDHAVGAPGVRAGLGFVPWGNQNLTAIDLATGEEVARIRVTDSVFGHAFAVGGDVYAGQQGVFRLTSAMAAGTKAEAEYIEPHIEPLGNLPGNPGFMVNAYQPPPSPKSAVHRIRFEWRPSGEGDVQLADGNLYLRFYKLVFALDPSGGEVRWVYGHDADIVGASAQPGGLLLVDTEGRTSFIGASDGLVRWSKDTETSPTVARLRVGEMAPSGPPQGEVAPLRDQLLAAAQHSDARLVPARVLAINLLAEMEEAAVTDNLIALCDDDGGPAEVRDAACGKLGARSVGAEHVLAALDRHASYLEGTRAPPVGPLATAAVRMDEARAVPKLIAHLDDPATPESHLAPLLTAIGELGDEGAAEPVGDFLRLYHADEPTDALVEALGTATQTLVALQGPVARDLLQEIARDPLGIPEVRGYARRAITAIDEAEKKAEQQEAEAEAEGDEADDGEQSDETDEADGDEQTQAEEGSEQETAEQKLPERITTPIVEQVLEPVQGDMQTCLLKADGKPRSARILLVLTGDGDIRQLSIRPEATSECLEPHVRSQQFPGNRRGTVQRVIYTLRR